MLSVFPRPWGYWGANPYSKKPIHHANRNHNLNSPSLMKYWFWFIYPMFVHIQHPLQTPGSMDANCHLVLSLATFPNWNKPYIYMRWHATWYWIAILSGYIPTTSPPKWLMLHPNRSNYSLVKPFYLMVEIPVLAVKVSWVSCLFLFPVCVPAFCPHVPQVSLKPTFNPYFSFKSQLFKPGVS